MTAPVDIELADICVSRGRRLRAIRDDLVAELAQSMNKQGLLHQVMVRRRMGGGYTLVCGWHRLEAAKLLSINPTYLSRLIRNLNLKSAVTLAGQR